MVSSCPMSWVSGLYIFQKHNNVTLGGVFNAQRTEDGGLGPQGLIEKGIWPQTFWCRGRNVLGTEEIRLLRQNKLKAMGEKSFDWLSQGLTAGVLSLRVMDYLCPHSRLET